LKGFYVLPERRIFAGPVVCAEVAKLAGGASLDPQNFTKIVKY
jgi:hypothetical protein